MQSLLFFQCFVTIWEVETANMCMAEQHQEMAIYQSLLVSQTVGGWDLTFRFQREPP